ncbi:autotransporter assembly complex protein TamA [Brevundimonas lenta]|uniref:Translocation and assembly module TamA n=1 Tax=Brevundimonas lenta TaxID=424796 RepID=A0A7W6NPJ3_9CAUL|nr:autotransporter assembly complex family protein [Brevundimonas lenta]MBB4083475.1 translocation and assembly module TamA [Brevundimonas lenta]
MKQGPAFFLFSVAGLAFASAAAADPRAQIRGEMDADLREQLVRAVGEVDGPPANRFEARGRARSAMQAAEALLRSEGYYQPVLEDEVEGEENPIAIVTVVPGRRFLIANPAVRWIEPEPDPTNAATAISEMGLTPGDPGRAVEVIAAEGRIVAGLNRRGYADAKAEPRRVVVDHATFSVQPTYNIASGQLVRLDGIRMETRGPTNAQWVAGLAPWSEGDVYDPEDVAELERRLLDTGVYDGVGVALAPVDQTTADGHRPIIVTLTDRPRRILEAGATFSTSGGSGVDAHWTWYNRFGRADTLVWEARLTDLDSRLGGSLSLPHWRNPGQTLTLAGALVNEDTDAYRRTALTASADLRQRLGKTSWFSYGIALDAGRYNENRFDPDTQQPVTLDRDLVILTGRGGFFMDRSDDPLNPTTGWRLLASAQPTAVTGEDTVFFLRAESQATAYIPLQQAKTVLAGRVRIGSIVGGSELTVPSDRLFYSGGGGSVRGYEFQGINPRLPDNTPRGGLSLFEASAEVRRTVWRNLQAVAFVDAGAIGFQEIPNLNNTRYGAGFGVRYLLSFGPIRADIAFPLDKREGDADFQVYVSIGQAF